MNEYDENDIEDFDEYLEYYGLDSSENNITDIDNKATDEEDDSDNIKELYF